MKIQPTTDKPQPSFGERMFKFAKPTSYGKRIHGFSRGYNYDVYVKENEATKEIEHKLYCVFQKDKWVKSVLKFFSNNKLTKEIRSQA